MDYKELKNNYYGQFDRLKANAKFAYSNALEALSTLTEEDLEIVKTHLGRYSKQIRFYEFADNLYIMFYSVFYSKKQIDKESRLRDEKSGKEITVSTSSSNIEMAIVFCIPGYQLTQDTDGFQEIQFDFSNNTIIFKIEYKEFAEAIFGNNLIKWHHKKAYVSMNFFD